jgi:4-hydroxybenzoate polyprenyltransferase
VRWREWHDSKLQIFLVAICYALLRPLAPGWPQLATAWALIVLLCLYAAFGHIVNDAADLEADRRAGKPKQLATWSKSAIAAAITLPCIGAASIAATCFDAAATELTIATFCLAALYSLPPVRLKERGLLGWFSAALAQRTLPVSIVFEALHAWDVAALALVVLSTQIGLRFIIIHQLTDRTNDLRAGVRTLATEQNPRVLVTLLHWVFALEIATLCASVFAMAAVEPKLGAAALAYAACLALAVWQGVPFTPRAYFVLSGYYHVIWPVGTALLLGLRHPAFLSLTLLTSLLARHQAELKFRELLAFARARTNP